REIGVRKAIGARRNDIRLQFLLEAALIGVIGGVLGLVLGGISMALLPLLVDASVAPPPEMVVAALLVSIGVGLLSGYSPARRAASLQPVRALRYE
ncbi:MAG: ABC transporter permease, partial [Gammaproteobacteria bacterium]|nr:ABC transporter permease [Gammaproteobacteria bacterium]